MGIMTQPLTSQIEHIVVVMLENRSFDNMLGGLYPPSDTFDGLTGNETNPLDPSDPKSRTVKVWQGPPGIDAMITPFPDPNEDFDDMTLQLFGSDGVGADASTVPAMNGFAWNYLSAKSMGGVAPNAADIMQYYAPGSDGNIPITSALAAAYTFSDRWFASGPVQTFANRVFNHCGTPGTALFDVPYLNDPDYFFVIKVHGGIDDPSVFSTLDAAFPKQINWKVYYQDEAEKFDLPFGILSALLVKYVRDVYDADNQTQVVQYAQFATDVANDTLPPYSFIEPRYFEAADGRSQSNHPGNAIAPGTTANPMAISVCDGEAFLADIYNTLSATPAVFDKTLLVVIYDEHGGLYDHVPPPAAPSPFANGTNGFDYSRYGVRVPCLLINPYVNRADGVAYRPTSSANPFDHTSIIRTVFQQFLPSDQQQTSLTPRDANAPALTNLIDPSNTRIPDVTLSSRACPIPPTFFGPVGEVLSSRQKLMQAIAEGIQKKDAPERK
jgi:phospholipase C